MDNKYILQKVIFLNIILVIAEIGAGIFSGSMALIADAFHNLGDVLALVISLVAIIYGAKEATKQMTFGYIKAEMMAAFVNSLFLIITMIFIFLESINRFFEPNSIDAPIVIFTSLIALVINGYSSYLLSEKGVSHHHHHDEEDSHHHHHQDLNISSAYLHMLGDAIISLSVVVGGIVIYFFGIVAIDTILSSLFSIYIIKETYPLLKKSFISLMDGNSVDLEAVTALILEVPEVHSIHDLHIYNPNSKEVYGSIHIVFSDNLDLKTIEHIIENIRKKLLLIGISHFVIQPESVKYHSTSNQCENHL
ncbi:MAG: cation diffusion facilitator family transporter [Arcobacteraceae bacterium]|nr:cation diffusion facilitator family transporter [Arcobacteraceae bacterium]